jgi:transcriptional regulator with XRE-family HTH domain
MTFHDKLNDYILQAKCSSKELAQASKLSEGTISRYRKGYRVPNVRGDHFAGLTKGLYGILSKQDPDITEEEISESLKKLIDKSYGIDYDTFIDKLKLLLREFEISNNELGNLWNAMTYLYEEGMIFSDGDFKIKYVKKLKTDRTEREYRTETPVLMLRLNHFIGKYKRMAKQQGEMVMSKDSIRYYLTTSGAYLGVKPSERWKVFQDGKPKTEVRVETGGQSRCVDICKFDRCMCFDYLSLKNKFDLNLESVSAETAAEREAEEQAEEDKYFKKKNEPDMFD